MNLSKVRSYMRTEVYEPNGYRGPYIDRCGEVNYTALAEAAAYEFNLYGPAPEFEISEEIFELAMNVGAAVERKLREEQS